jgi:hypothetical protein
MALPSIDQTFFTQLDKETHKLRTIAKNFAEYLKTSSIGITEKQKIVEPLEQINSCKIDIIYVAINNFGEQITKISEVMKNSELDKTGKWAGFFEYYTSFLEQINTFMKKAFELEKNLI